MFPTRLSDNQHKNEQGNEWAICISLIVDRWKPNGCETQRTDVDPRARVAHSQQLESSKTRGRLDNAWTGNNQGRSTTGNVFNRLGKGADMRDILNRRWEQERSQHSTAQRWQSKANPQGVRNIPLEDLRHVIVSIEEQDDELVAEAGESPFCKEIREAPLPEGVKLPNIKAYEGKANPQDHLDHFNDLMELHMVSKNVKCRGFTITLSNGAKK